MTGCPERACTSEVKPADTVRIRSVTADILIGLALVTVVAFSVLGHVHTGKSGPLDPALRMLGIQPTQSIEAAALTPWQVWAVSNGYRDAATAPLTTSRAAFTARTGHRSAYMLLGLLFTLLLAADIFFLSYLGCTYAAPHRRRCNRKETD
jgi:hypothetical protein